MIKTIVVFLAIACVIACAHMLFSEIRDKSYLYHSLIMGAIYSAISGIILLMFVELF